MTTWVNGAETDLPDGTVYTAANSNANGEGFTFTPSRSLGGSVTVSTNAPIFGTRSVMFSAPAASDVARGSISGLFSSTNVVLDFAFRTDRKSVV